MSAPTHIDFMRVSRTGRRFLMVGRLVTDTEGAALFLFANDESLYRAVRRVCTQQEWESGFEALDWFSSQPPRPNILITHPHSDESCCLTPGEHIVTPNIDWVPQEWVDEFPAPGDERGNE